MWTAADTKRAGNCARFPCARGRACIFYIGTSSFILNVPCSFRRLSRQCAAKKRATALFARPGESNPSTFSFKQCRRPPTPSTSAAARFARPSEGERPGTTAPGVMGFLCDFSAEDSREERQWFINKETRGEKKSCRFQWNAERPRGPPPCVLSRTTLLTSLKTKHCIDLTGSPLGGRTRRVPMGDARCAEDK